MTTCPRCSNDSGEGRFCAVCGLDLSPDHPRLPTPDAIGAGRREADWLAANPGAMVDLPASYLAQERERVHQEWTRRAPMPPRRTLANFSPMGVSAFAARASLVTVIGATGLGALFEAMHIAVLSDRPVSTTALITSDGRLGAAYIAVALAYVLSAIAFIVWLYAARLNTEALGATSHRFGPGWAIGGWFVPILGLWRPKQVVDDVWRGSTAAPSPPRDPAAWLRAPVPAFLHWWWGLWIVAAILERISSRAYDVNSTFAEQHDAMVFSLSSSLVTLAAGILAIRVVSQITERQRERAAEQRQLAAMPPPQGESAVAAATAG